MTFLFPLIAAIMSVKPQRTNSASPTPQEIAILIPAHNEEATLPITLKSITEAISAVGTISPCRFRILVGADGCTDKTETTALGMGAEVLVMPSQIGKWGTISALVEKYRESHWTVLADCGVEWPRDFLVKLLPLLSREDVIGVAPTYRNDASGLVERVVWGTERAIKMIESKCGGPVSVHGATVCYRTKELSLALRSLSDRHWLNDDIVIPLCLRALYPTKKLEYAANLIVNDNSSTYRPASREFIRRRRLVHGNIEWIRHLWGTIWKQNFVVGILASRRVFRLLWGYWAASSALTLALHADIFALPAPQLWGFTIACGALVSCVKQLRTLLDSGLASILTPYYFVAATLRSPTTSYVTRWN